MNFDTLVFSCFRRAHCGGLDSIDLAWKRDRSSKSLGLVVLG